MKRLVTLVAGLILLVSSAFSQSYQTETNQVLEKFAANYSNLFITKGPTEIVINDTTYLVAGAVSNGSIVVAVSWEGQNTPGKNAVYTFLQYDTTSISINTFGSKLFNDITAQFNLSGIKNTKKALTGTVFPNPSGGLFTLVLPHKIGTYTARIFDGSGKYIQQKKGILTAGIINMNLTGLPKGNYLTEVFTTNKIYVFHLLIK